MDHLQARLNMVLNQIKPWEVTDESVISLMTNIPREHFVPKKFKELAYADLVIPLDSDENMLEPKVIAKILQALHLNGFESILEIGTGSGYLSAILSRFCANITSVEIKQEIADHARSNFKKCNIDSIDLRVTDGLEMLEKKDKNYDVIILTGSLPQRPSRDILEKLNPKGKLFAFVGNLPVMWATIYNTLDGKNFTESKLFQTVVEPLQTGQVSKQLFF